MSGSPTKLCTLRMTFPTTFPLLLFLAEGTFEDERKSLMRIRRTFGIKGTRHEF